MEPVTVIGAGIAGSEAAWQLAERGIPVHLIEMRPDVMPPAHHTGGFAELVCSNSLKGMHPETAAGMLKNELRGLGSFVLAAAEVTSIPAGAALAVDRVEFSEYITERLERHPMVTVQRREAVAIPKGDTVIATGPIPSLAIQQALSAVVGENRLAFYDAAAPIIDAASIDMEKVFSASRWERGSADYLNCPLDRHRYDAFVNELVAARRVELRSFERRDLFQACQPVEEIARSGKDALRFGALKPVGLVDPVTGDRPWAVVQLRPENRDRTAYNLVGFQTNLAFEEQKRVFRMLPGLENAEFFRYGVMHRNAFVDAPQLLTSGLALRDAPNIHLAGQLTGTEGYMEAAATGLVAAIDIWTTRNKCEPLVLPKTTVLGALIAYATDPDTHDYQPMHVNFGLVPPLSHRVRGKRNRYAAYAQRGSEDMISILNASENLCLLDSAVVLGSDEK